MADSWSCEMNWTRIASQQQHNTWRRSLHVTWSILPSIPLLLPPCQTVVERQFVKRFALSHRTVVLSCPVPSVCNMWPNGWRDQDETWHAGRPRPWPHCARWEPSSPSPKRGHSPPTLTHVYCDQTAGWIKMPLGMEVGVGPGRIVLDGDPAPRPKKGHSPPIFGRCLLWPNCRPSQLLLSTCFIKHLVGRVASGEIIVQLLKSKCLPALYAIAWTHEHWTVISLDHWSSLSTAVYLGRFLRYITNCDWRV